MQIIYIECLYIKCILHCAGPNSSTVCASSCMHCTTRNFQENLSLPVSGAWERMQGLLETGSVGDLVIELCAGIFWVFMWWSLCSCVCFAFLFVLLFCFVGYTGCICWWSEGLIPLAASGTGPLDKGYSHGRLVLSCCG